MSTATSQRKVDRRGEPTAAFREFDSLGDSVMINGRSVEQILDISAATRWRLEQTGELVGYKFGRSKRYRCGDIRQLMASAAQAVA